MVDQKDGKKSVKECPRCKKILNSQTGKWSKSHYTKNIISNFNNDKLLIGVFGKIEIEDVFCPDCQSLLPEMTVERFKKCLNNSGQPILVD